MTDTTPANGAELRERVRPHMDAALPATSRIATRWVQLADAGWLTSEPPRLNWLLTRADGMGWAGVLLRGRTGLLAAAGGTGKTYALAQLALAVASGSLWLGTFRAENPGHVCLALGEEDAAELHRRLWRACAALELSREQRSEIAQRIHAIPLHGVDVAMLTQDKHGEIAHTPVARELRRELDARDVAWSLIVLDPLSRFAGAGCESNNEAATRFCQVVESLTAARGNPTVLVAHHASKLSVREGAADARGVTGIYDGFRWAAMMDEIVDNDGNRLIKLRNTKSNYSARFDDIYLARSDEPETTGTLRLADDDEAEPFRRAAQKTSAAERAAEQVERKRKQARDDAPEVVRILRANPGIGVRALRAQTCWGHPRTDAALAALGAAVESATGPNNSRPMTLNEAAIPDEIREVLT